MLLGTASLAVTGTGQFCEKEPCGSSWRKEFRGISLPSAFLVTDSRELCYSRTQGSVSRMRGAAWPHKPSYPTAPPGRDAGSYTGPRLTLLPPAFPFRARKAAQPFQSCLLLCKTPLPGPFLCVTPIAARPPCGRLAGAQASNSKQHVARLAAGRAPGHRLSCLPRSNSAALCAPRHAEQVAACLPSICLCCRGLQRCPAALGSRLVGSSPNKQCWFWGWKPSHEEL